MSVLLNGQGFKIFVTHFGKKKTTPPFFRSKSHWIYHTKSGLAPKFVPIEQKSFAFPEAPKQPSTMSCKYGKTIGKHMNLSLFIPRKQKPKTCSSGKWWRCDFFQQSFTVALMVYNNLHIHLQQIHWRNGAQHFGHVGQLPLALTQNAVTFQNKTKTTWHSVTLRQIVLTAPFSMEHLYLPTKNARCSFRIPTFHSEARIESPTDPKREVACVHPDVCVVAPIFLHLSIAESVHVTKKVCCRGNSD